MASSWIKNSPRVYLFKGSPSALTYTLRQENVPYAIRYGLQYSELVELLLTPASELYHYVLLDYQEGIELPRPPEASAYIPTLSLVGEPLNFKQKKQLPPWLEIITPTPPKKDLAAVLKTVPVELREPIADHLEHYPQQIQELLQLPEGARQLALEAQCLEVATMRRWLELLLKDPRAALNQLEEREITVWLGSFPECIAKYVVTSVSSLLWVYFCLFIDAARQRNLPNVFALRQFCYWYWSITHLLKKPVVRLKYLNGKPRLWITPSLELLNLTSLFLENFYE